mmetsp:Transcript_21970/g.32450  ORF Transcript_21970/g.32450 Transcript_21970/m.32450 type:complete len:291 (-) Transcript_21970:123-995(-)|eukprot:CAMPEP_0194213698 /NCGR_PEP_ID=MMETSP0156-20130528/14473_1 /TAXON_ID=33649 /ORGANISM="Thalassionema nitzschioides, Strain L26-B" /LENGTH=290 /DNA_ID=CAMNT_0038941793 /DNA_START=143 /DNA_END=1015 /DNA_ORIENTATION=-
MRRDNSLESLLNKSLLQDEKNVGPNLSPSTVSSSRTNKSSPVSVMASLEDLDGECKVEIEQKPIRLETVFNEDVNTTPPRHPSLPLKHVSQRNSQSRRRNETIGNFWNAKGLNKAKSGEWENAVVFWENALEARIQAFGENHIDVANTLNNIGIALGRLERFEEAITHLDLVKEIREEHYGTCHLEIAATLHNVANVFQQMKDYDGALKCFKEAKHIQETLLKHDDMLVVRTVCAIGHLHYEHGQYEDALGAYEQAREGMEQVGVRGGNFEYDNLLLDISDSKNAMAGSL